MSIHKLTATKIATLVRAGKQGKFGDGGGLYLQIDGRSASWLFRYKSHGRERAMGLGPLHTVGLENARAAALAARQGLLDGRDPLAERGRAGRAIKTLDECIALFLADKQAAFSVKHRLDWERTLAIYASPLIGALPVNAIDRQEVLRSFKPIWAEKAKTAGQVRSRMERVLQWASVPRLPQRREPGALERPSRACAATDQQSPRGRASRRLIA